MSEDTHVTMLSDIKTDVAEVRRKFHELSALVTGQIGKTEISQLNLEHKLALMQKDVDHLVHDTDRNQKEREAQFDKQQLAFNQKFEAHCLAIDTKFADQKIIKRDYLGWIVAVGMFVANMLIRKFGWP